MYFDGVCQGSEEINEEGAIETKVEAVDYRSPSNQQQDEQPKKEHVSVVHLTRKKPPHSGRGVLVGAAEAVGNAVQSVKDATSGGGKDETHK